MIASARHRAAVLGETPAVPRISDLGHLYASSLGKLELDLMGTHQMTERQVLDAVMAEAIATVFAEYVDKHGLAEIAQIFSEGVKIEVGDMLPSSHYAELVKRVPPIWDKAFEVNASQDPAVRASCIEFVLAGLYATDRISRSQRHGRIVYETVTHDPRRRSHVSCPSCPTSKIYCESLHSLLRRPRGRAASACAARSSCARSSRTCSPSKAGASSAFAGLASGSCGSSRASCSSCCT